jgi:hypothetical protein
MIELPVNEFIRLFQLAYLGKLIGGLVHNLNGPMQNLGLDIEMANYSLKDESVAEKEKVEGIRTRLKRMEDEYEKIDRLIKSCSTKAVQNEDYFQPPPNFDEFIERELQFLQSNLYFKHNVRTEQVFQENPLSTRHFSIHSLLALSWFFQIIIEEIESEEVKGLTLKSAVHNGFQEMTTITREGSLSEKFMISLNKASSFYEGQEEDYNIEIMLILMMFEKEGIHIESRAESSGSEIKISLPIRNSEG